MKRAYFKIINLVYGIAIPAWLLICAGALEFDVGFKWKLSENVIPNVTFLSIAIAIETIVFIRLFSRFKKHGKDSALLLASFNALVITQNLLETFGNFTGFHEIFGQANENLIFILVGWSLIFFLLFVQDIFTGGFSFKKHKHTHLIFSSIIVVLTGFLMVSPFMPAYPSLEVIMNIGFGLMGALIITLAIWLLIATNKLAKKAGDQVTRIGLRMIGSSGVLYIAILISVGLKSLAESISTVLDIITPILIMATSIVTYLGYVFPSKKRKKGD